MNSTQTSAEETNMNLKEQNADYQMNYSKARDISSFPSVDSLDHKRYSLGLGSHQCPVCGKVVRGGVTNFRSHYVTHTHERPFVCPYCPYRARQLTHIKSHVGFRHKELLNSSSQSSQI